MGPRERVKYLLLDGLRRLLDPPKGKGVAAIRDRAILALMSRHGLRVSEVARPMYGVEGRKRSGLKQGEGDLGVGTVGVTG